MKIKWGLAAMCAALAMVPFVPASAKTIPVQIRCTATGSGDYRGDWEGYDAWANIVATGVCVPKAQSMPAYSVEVTGSGDQSLLRLNLQLANPHGGSRGYPQTWIGVPGSQVILAANKVPVGTGSVTAGWWSVDFGTQEVSFAWTFLAWITP